eukprot:scaffold33052_cov107-Isochrysis_galbana.AAC.3
MVTVVPILNPKSWMPTVKPALLAKLLFLVRRGGSGAGSLPSRCNARWQRWRAAPFSCPEQARGPWSGFKGGIQCPRLRTPRPLAARSLGAGCTWLLRMPRPCRQKRKAVGAGGV